MAKKLHIGGRTRSEGWEVLNAQAAPYVDHVCSGIDRGYRVDRGRDSTIICSGANPA